MPHSVTEASLLLKKTQKNPQNQSGPVICRGIIYYPASIPGQVKFTYILFRSNKHSRFILRQDVKILCKKCICLDNSVKVHRGM